MTTTQGALEGELSFTRVPQLLHHAAQLAAGGELDISGVSRADSAGLALLIELSRRARAGGGTLRIRGAGEQVLQLARYFGLEQVLHFESAH
jgi:phospholipid transport system transporter-binding protein